MTPLLLEDSTEGYADVPVVVNGSEPRRIYILAVPHPRAGDLWDIRAEVHVTNDNLRDRGKGVATVTEVRLQDNDSNVRTGGLSLIRSRGWGNVGVERHHDQPSRSRFVKWTQEAVNQLPDGQLYLKFFLMAKSTAAEMGDNLVITPGGGHFQLCIWPADASPVPQL